MSEQSSLPDEIISEILSPALKVSDKGFSDTSNVSPFAEYTESTSAYLLVCKAWLRVSTPLLYNVVILRSKAQTKALAQTLSKNQELGQFIKKLRVEGGYGAPMATILKYSPNISDLFISFEIWASDKTDGLCKGLSLINPMRVILRDSEYKQLNNKMVANLEDALTVAISKWDRLSIFDLPYIDDPSNRALKIVAALVKSRRLQTVVIPRVQGASWTYAAFKECPLQTIQIKQPLSKLDLEDLERDTTPIVKALVKFTERLPAVTWDSAEPPQIAPSLNPFFVPMNGASMQVQDTIWKRVLYFALSVSELAGNPVRKDIPPRLPLLLVSKTFLRLALPYYYTHPKLKNLRATANFLAVLQQNPSLAPQVRTICGELGNPPWYFDSDDESDAGDIPPSPDSILKVLSKTTGLVRLCGWSSKEPAFRAVLEDMETPISWDAFEAVAKYSGSTLRQFSKRIRLAENLKAPAAIFGHLTELRSLEWKSSASFDPEDTPPCNALTNLTELRVLHSDPSFLTVLSAMKLPSLRCLLLDVYDLKPSQFLHIHGNKLTELDISYGAAGTLKSNIFEVCSRLELVSFHTGTALPVPGPPDAKHFSSDAFTCPSLTRITIDMPYWAHQKDQVAKWDAFLAAFKPKCFPNLREIKFKRCEWPTSERQIAKNCWVRWAELLLKVNIHLTDKDGKKWRPRLKLR
ncbi:hypothetical protein C8R44DRAFT_188691 [Mycena epipterygia]|nr:hypothetical protein C8R44DRAFT_188691 [Mycena epipterygia]